MLTSADVRDSFKYLFPAELPALKELVMWLGPEPLVINIGSGAGTSGLAIIEARPDSKLVTIDITDASSPFGCLEAERDVIYRAGYSHIQYVRWIQIHDSSVTVGKGWQQMVDTYPLDNSVFARYPDMVFIDGDHSYEGCKADIEAWLPLIKNKGILAVHDYRKSTLLPNKDGPHPQPWPGVDRAVQEILLPDPAIEVCMHVDSLIAFRIVENGKDSSGV